MIIVFNHQQFNQSIIVYMAIATGMATILFASLSAIYANHKHGAID